MAGNKKRRLLLFMLAAVGMVWWYHHRVEPHSVTLTWQAPPSRHGVTVVGYNVYRRAGEGGAFVKVVDRVAGPPYEDLLVNSGRTYFYVVTSVDQAGRESRFSAETKAEVP